MKTKREAAGSALIILGVLSLAVCIWLVSGNIRESRQARDSVTRRLGAVKEYIAGVREDPAANEAEEEGFFSSEPEKEMPVAEIGGDQYIGILSLPTLGLEMAVTSECSLYTLRETVGRYSGSVRTGDLVIAGHNYSTGFSQLRQLSLGDQLTFTEMDGQVHSYTVQELEILEPDSVDQMINSDWELSLYTCTYTGRQRLTVRCSEEGSHYSEQGEHIR